jgi:hypothetical protein
MWYPKGMRTTVALIWHVYLLCIPVLAVYRSQMPDDWLVTPKHVAWVSERKTYVVSGGKIWRFSFECNSLSYRDEQTAGVRVAATNKSCTVTPNTVKSVKLATRHSWRNFHDTVKFLWYYTWPMVITPYLGHLLFSWILATVSHVVATLSVCLCEWVQRNSAKLKHWT